MGRSIGYWNPLLFGIIFGALLNLDVFTVQDEGGAEAGEYVGEEGAEPTTLDQMLDTISYPVKKSGDDKKSVNRPRFVRDEMEVKERLFVGFLVDGKVAAEDYKSFPRYLNLTTRQQVGKVVLFTTQNSSFSNESNAVLLPEASWDSVLHYIKDMKGAEYLFYYLAPSSLLLSGHALNNIVDNVRFATEDIIIGQPSSDSEHHCDIKQGILFSHSVIKSNQFTFTNIPGCSEYSDLYKPATIDEAKEKDFYPTAIHGLKSANQFHAAAMYLLQWDLKRTMEDLEQKKDDLSSYILETEHLEPSWPPEIYRPRLDISRKDSDVFEYFNGTLAEVDVPDMPRRPVTSPEQYKFGQLLDACYPNQQARLQSVWRKVDHDLGVQYLIKAEGEDSGGMSDCSVFQEFSDPLMISLPFVTETAKISLVVPVTEADTQDVLKFLQSFSTVCLQKNDRVFLMLVFMYSKERPDKNNNNDFYKSIKQAALQLSKKFKKKDKASSILWYSLQLQDTSLPSPLETLDLLVTKLDTKSIILLGSANMELHTEYLNRVRMNTIEGRLVFSPIPSMDIHPKVAELTKPKNSQSGHGDAGLSLRFDQFNFQHFSFFKNDYLALRNHSKVSVVLKEESFITKDKQQNLPTEAFRVPELFEKYSHLRRPLDSSAGNLKSKGSLHLIRAPEPRLRLRYKTVVCEKHWPEQIYTDCLLQREMSLGSRTQLASILLDQQS